MSYTLLLLQAEWKQRHLSSERMVAVLQDRLSVTRANLEQQDKTVGQLQDDLQAATDELQLWREQQAQGLEKFDQVGSITPYHRREPLDVFACFLLL